MRTIRNLINQEKKVYILLNSKAIRYRFMSDAAREGITYGDGENATERTVDDIMVLKGDGTICFLGFAGRMYYHHNKRVSICVDYEKYINGSTDCEINLNE